MRGLRRVACRSLLSFVKASLGCAWLSREPCEERSEGGVELTRGLAPQWDALVRTRPQRYARAFRFVPHFALLPFWKRDAGPSGSLMYVSGSSHTPI